MFSKTKNEFRHVHATVWTECSFLAKNLGMFSGFVNFFIHESVAFSI